MHPKTRDQAPAGWATLATLSVLTVVAVLVLATGGPAGPAKTSRAAENCPADGGGGDGTPSPTASESPSMSGLPIPTLPIPTGDESETPTPSPSDGTAKKSCNSKITIDYKKKADAFKGAVSSKLSDCEGGRKVVLNKDQARPKKDVKVGATTTKPSGKWSIKGFEDPPGKYYAKVKKDTTTADGETVVCKPAKSKTINP